MVNYELLKTYIEEREQLNVIRAGFHRGRDNSTYMGALHELEALMRFVEDHKEVE